jgi:hypothetical protein
MKRLAFFLALAAVAASSLFAGNQTVGRAAVIRFVPPAVVVPPPVAPAAKTYTLTFEQFLRIRQSQYLELASGARSLGLTTKAETFQFRASIQFNYIFIFPELRDAPYDGTLGDPAVMPDKI